MDAATAMQRDHRRELRRLGGILREMRVQSGLRQADLAERLARSQSYVTKYESGERRLDLYELELVCRALRVDLEECIKKFRAHRRSQ